MDAAPSVAEPARAPAPPEDPRHQPVRAATLRRARVSGPAAGAARTGARRRRPRTWPSSRPCASSSTAPRPPGPTSRSTTRTRRPSPRSASGSTACRWRSSWPPRAIRALPPRAHAPADGASTAAADGRCARPAGPPADAARRHRLELRPAGAGRAGAVPANGRLPRLHPGGAPRRSVPATRPGRARPRLRCRRWTWTSWTASSRWSRRACCARRRRRTASPGIGCWRRSASSPWSGSRRAASRTPSIAGRPSSALRLAEAAEPEMYGAEQTSWYARLEQEHDNLRAALRWCEERGYAEPALRLAVALWWFWSAHGHLEEGRERLASAAGAVPAAPVRSETAPRAGALYAAGMLASMQGDHDAARSLLEEGLALRRQLDDRGGLFNTLEGLATVAFGQGDSRPPAATSRRCSPSRMRTATPSNSAPSSSNWGISATSWATSPARAATSSRAPRSSKTWRRTTSNALPCHRRAG